MAHKMDELKQKLLILINKQPPKIPSMGFNDANYHFSQVTNLSINSKTVTDVDRPADQDILESIQAAYFSKDEDFDICRFELKKLPEVLDCDQIQRDFKNLKQQHQVVSKKVLQLILENQTGCNVEFEKVTEILNEVRATLELCRISRRELKVAGSQFSACLGILANYRKRKIAQNLLNNLIMIKNLHSFDTRCQILMNDENYVAAITELKRCQKIATKYRHFSCVAALTYKLQETLENTDAQLDRVLAQTCFHFDGDRYRKLQAAYNLLEKSSLSMIDNLHVHYITAIYNSSFNVVQSYISSPDILESSENSGKNPYKILCQSINQNVFIGCLVHLCKILFKIVLSYRQLVKWHNNSENESQTGNDNFNIENTMSKQKLEHNLVKIWDDVQRKVSSLLLNADLASYKFDQFVQILRVVQRLILVGEEFCSSKSEDLQESIRKQSVNYFKNYHAQRLDELKIFLENEMWEICPVKPSFDILQLQEFKSFRYSLKNFKFNPQVSPTMINYSTNSTECCSSNHSQDGSSIVGNYFVRYADHGTPFDSRLDETIIEEDILASENEGSGYFSEDSEEEEPEELRRDYVDEENDSSRRPDKKEKHHYKCPILTNTTLSILRQIGKYIQMSRLLQPIAYQIISCMNQLFDYYLYSVHLFFAKDLSISSNSLYSQELNITLKKISDNLISEMVSDEEDSNSQAGKVLKPSLTPMVDLGKPETLHGLAERIVAVESLIFLSKQYEFLQDYLEHLVPQTNKIMLQQFFSQNITCAADMRYPVYMAVVAKAFDLRQILILMSKINWEVRDVRSMHNSYIDVILKEVQNFTQYLEKVSGRVPISPEVYKNLWENIAHIVTHTFVQGFSGAKKCTNGGRALMQLDFAQFLMKFEKISSLRPVPHKEYVENYVKAYYLPDIELEKWLREHKEYSSEHLFGLVSCACQNNKKIRQRLLQVIEDLEKNQFGR
ncbi:vacuolar protein sorting 50 isoform X1 [Leptinotarsa decemlineata]|uniref:vacuolar protein sorting 50 isoform X1 n=2 Tax=Leptinotarsa decemlineata TaxID=7539 RepID=UPI003D307CDC